MKGWVLSLSLKLIKLPVGKPHRGTKSGKGEKGIRILTTDSRSGKSKKKDGQTFFIPKIYAFYVYIQYLKVTIDVSVPVY